MDLESLVQEVLLIYDDALGLGFRGVQVIFVSGLPLPPLVPPPRSSLILVLLLCRVLVLFLAPAVLVCFLLSSVHCLLSL